jgi:hypothetical protein
MSRGGNFPAPYFLAVDCPASKIVSGYLLRLSLFFDSLETGFSRRLY